jgi:hypothetical protein
VRETEQEAQIVISARSRGRRRRLVLLSIAALAVATAVLAVAGTPAAAAPTELFFSEYVEGSGNNKALEVYNGTGATVTLTGVYDVQIFANGSATATATIPLTGVVLSGDVFVLVRSAADPALLAVGDQSTTNFLYNGNDSVALRKAGVVIDVIGQLGNDPGIEWGTGDASTTDNTLRRKTAIQAGDLDGTDAFDPSAQWLGFPNDMFDGLGAHSTTSGGPGSAPVAMPDSATVEEDDPASAIAVLVNDTDADGNPITITGVSDPADGAAAVSGSTVLYTPDVDFFGTDAFSYTITDGNGNADSATVTVTVGPVNDDPDPEDDTATLAEDSTITVAVLTNDLDVDDNGLTVTEVDDPDHGTATVASDSSGLVYVPDPDWNGADTFSYTVSDGQGGSDNGLVTVTTTPINDPPRASPDTFTVASGVSTILPVAANDSPGPANEAGQTLTVVSTTSPSHGIAETVTSGPDAGKVRYTPAAGYTGPDSFAYQVSDGTLTATATVALTVTAPALRSLCGLVATIVGTKGDDVITGTPADDVIYAKRGDDVIEGGGGNDVICGGPGADRITTLGGHDRIAGGAGADTIDAGDGRNRLRGGFGSDTIRAGSGNDGIASGAGNDTVDAGDGANTVKGGAGDDALTSGVGDDRLDGGPGLDTCVPGPGRNVLKACD